MATPYRDFERFRKVIESWTKQYASKARHIEVLVKPPALRQMADYLNSVHRQWSFLEKMVPRIDLSKVEEWWKRGLPPNWVDAEPRLEVTEVLELMRETRWCLVWVPRGSVVRRLVDSDENGRSEVFLASSSEIIEDASSVLDAIDHPELQQLCRAGGQIASAIEAGLDMAAQALAATCLSDVINKKFGMSFRQAQKDFMVEDPMEIPWVRFRQATVLLLVAEALENYWEGDPVPVRFSRHASAHSVSEEQYNKENALAGLLLVTAFLMEADLLAGEQLQGDDAA
jgi:hypothetical protein